MTHGLVCVYDRLHIYEKCINEYKLKNNALFNKVFFYIWFEKGLRDEKTSSLWVNTCTYTRKPPPKLGIDVSNSVASSCAEKITRASSR